MNPHLARPAPGRRFGESSPSSPRPLGGALVNPHLARPAPGRRFGESSPSSPGALVNPHLARPNPWQLPSNYHITKVIMISDYPATPGNYPAAKVTTTSPRNYRATKLTRLPRHTWQPKSTTPLQLLIVTTTQPLPQTMPSQNCDYRNPLDIDHFL